MFIYILIAIAVIVLGRIIAQKRSLYNVSFVLIALILILFAGLRGDFTADYNGYASYFKYVNNLPFTELLSTGRQFSMEREFVILMRLIGCISKNKIFFMTVCSALTVVPMLITFKRYSLIPWVAVVLYLSIGDYYASFNLVRQMIAVAFTFYAFKYIKDGRFWKYALVILIAFCLHRTAIILLPVYFIMRQRVNIRNVLVMTGLGALTYLALPTIVAIVQSNYSRYSTEMPGLEAGSINSAVATAAALVFFLISYALQLTDLDINTPENRIIINGSVIALMFLLFGVRLTIVARCAYYFKPFSILLFTRTIASYKDQTMKRVIIVALVLVSLLYTEITLSGTGYDPYYTAF